MTGSVLRARRGEHGAAARLRAGRRGPIGACRRARREDGLTSLEMAIIFPVVLLVILLMFQISLYWHTANAVGVAAEQGLDAGQVHPEADGMAEAEAEAAARFILNRAVALPAPAEVTVTRVAGGERLRVTVSARTPRLVGVGSWEVRSVAEGRFETFVPADER
ncbi:MAG: TadE family protein [Actinomycetota bacterium]